METKFYVTKLTEHLANKQKLNSRYSLRAFARDLSMDSSTLSQILRGKRSLPYSASERVAALLNLTGPDREAFMQSLEKKRDYLKPEYEVQLQAI